MGKIRKASIIKIAETYKDKMWRRGFLQGLASAGAITQKEWEMFITILVTGPNIFKKEE